MLNQFFHIINLEYFKTHQKQYSDKKVHPLVIVESNDVSALSELTSYLNTPGQTAMEAGIFITGLDRATKNTLTKILPIICSYSYLSINLKPYVTTSVQETFSEIQKISEILYEQGYSDWEYSLTAIVNKELLKEGCNKIIHKKNNQEIAFNASDLKEYYSTYLLTDYSPADIFIFKDLTSGEFDSLIKIYDEVINDLPNPAKLIQFKSLSYYFNNNIQTEFKLKKLQNKFSIQQELLDLRNGSTEVTDILSFYHREYEALPLWYKRFGHILKFLLGRKKL